MREPDRELDFIGANRHGQQLALADLALPRRERRARTTDPAPPLQPPTRHGRHEQLVLFRAQRSLAMHGRADLHLRADPQRAAHLEDIARDIARQHAWSARQLEDTRYGLRIVLGIQDSPDGPIRASDAALLRDIDLPVWTVLKVLDAAGILDDDRTPAFDAWYATFVDGLPEQMTSELGIWFDIMKNGTPIAPRRRPRTETTIGLQLRWAMPSLRAWAAAGHTSLREITREQVLDILPPAGNPRSTTGQGLKSIFRMLKSRKTLFADPTTRVKTGFHESRQPMPANIQALRAALHSADLAQALLVALIAFHGLRAGQLTLLQLTDLRDGRLYLDGRVIVLAEPVRERVTAYLNHRNQRWPRTLNPHLFVHYRTASTVDPVGRRWIWLHVGEGLSVAAIREDRILDEAQATGGDARRLADLFGLSIHASSRYTATVDHPDLTELT